jgi:hypothetical protein
MFRYVRSIRFPYLPPGLATVGHSLLLQSTSRHLDPAVGGHVLKEDPLGWLALLAHRRPSAV